MSARRLPALVLGLAGLAAAARPAEVGFAAQEFPVAGRLLKAHLQDQDGDGRVDLTLAVLDPHTRRRELRVHRGTPDGRLAAEPAHVLRVLDDVVAWGWADVRDDPGAELLMLTRSGAFALSPSKPGLRGNIERLVEAPLIYDVPDLRGLPVWRYVLPHPDGDRLLLPESGGYRIWGPPRTADEAPAEGAPRYVVQADFVAAADAPRVTAEAYDEARDDALIDAALDLTGNALGLGGDLGLRRFLQDSVDVRAPALVDVDGDGRVDLLHREDGLRIHLADERGIPARPTRVEHLPDAVRAEDGQQRDLILADVDGDGDCDLLVQLRGERDGLLGKRTYDVFVLRNDGRRMLPETPDDLRRLEAAWSRSTVSDIDRDGRPDLVLEKAVGPSEIELASGQRPMLEYELLVFFGEQGGRFTRKPTISHSARYPFDELADALASTSMQHDLDGDGDADMVDVDLAGTVSFRRVQFESSFFGGDSWSLDASPWKTFENIGGMGRLVVLDVNGDDLGDVLTWRDDRATVLLSQRRGR